MKKSLLIIAATAFGATSATAGEPITVVADANVETVLVPFGDLDIVSDKGMKVLKGRIKQAAKGMCHFEGQVPLSTFQPYRRCFNEARLEGERQADELRQNKQNGAASVTASSVIVLQRR